MTFCPEWLTGSPNLNTSNALHLWVYLFVSSPPFSRRKLALHDNSLLKLDTTVHERYVCLLSSRRDWCSIQIDSNPNFTRQMGRHSAMAYVQFLRPHLPNDAHITGEHF